jgi:2-oxoglutarate ferredoxin oxidoreductase subunit alpha
MDTNYNLSFKICGQSGQGIDTIGKLACKSLMKAGYSVVGYREYPSLIKGGNATFQIDFSNYQIHSSSKTQDFIIVFNEQNTLWYENDLAEDGYIFHNILHPRFEVESIKTIKEKRLNFIFIDTANILRKSKGSFKMKNVSLLSKVFQIIDLPLEYLISALSEEFKDEIILQKNIDSASIAYKSELLNWSELEYTLHPKSSEIKFDDVDFSRMYDSLNSKQNELSLNNLYTDPVLITGNEALAYGAVSAKITSYFGYPMTPSSSIMSTLAKIGEKYGVLVKQVEDEITAAAMTMGSMMLSERALTATSGGGFDLMSEHISFSMMAEIPFVIILAQRPGPATGLPTWTSQGDLMLSIFAGHGESPRIVIAVSDVQTCYKYIQICFNLAQFYQIPVILLTDKLLAETYFISDKTEFENIGSLSNTSSINDKSHRYSLQENGVSPFWKIGEGQKFYCINSDEHDEDGLASEDAINASFMMEKRNLKTASILSHLPEPEYFTSELKNPKKTFKIISWGSTLGVLLDLLEDFQSENIKMEILHYTVVWPLHTEALKKFVDEETIIIEGNFNNQFAKIIKMETGIDINFKITKYDGRPFFRDELFAIINNFTEN